MASGLHIGDGYAEYGMSNCALTRREEEMRRSSAGSAGSAGANGVHGNHCATPQGHGTQAHMTSGNMRPKIMDITVFSVPYGYTCSGLPLFLQYGTQAAYETAKRVMATMSYINCSASQSTCSTGYNNNGQSGKGFEYEEEGWQELNKVPMPVVAYEGREDGRYVMRNGYGSEENWRNGYEGEEPRWESRKRARLNWTDDLHRRFVKAVEVLGVEKAVPTSIMRIMNEEGLTRENVASHLQKYRGMLKKEEEDKEREMLLKAAKMGMMKQGRPVSDEDVLEEVRKSVQGEEGKEGKL